MARIIENRQKHVAYTLNFCSTSQTAAIARIQKKYNKIELGILEQQWTYVFYTYGTAMWCLCIKGTIEHASPFFVYGFFHVFFMFPPPSFPLGYYVPDDPSHAKSIRRRICQQPRIDPVTNNPIKMRSSPQTKVETNDKKKTKKNTYSTPSCQQ